MKCIASNYSLLFFFGSKTVWRIQLYSAICKICQNLPSKSRRQIQINTHSNVYTPSGCLHNVSDTNSVYNCVCLNDFRANIYVHIISLFKIAIGIITHKIKSSIWTNKQTIWSNILLYACTSSVFYANRISDLDSNESSEHFHIWMVICILIHKQIEKNNALRNELMTHRCL